MNNGKIEDPPLQVIDRNPLWTLISVIISLLAGYGVYLLFSVMHPLGFILFVPAALLFFHTLWTLLHPFAGIYKDKFELSPSLFYQPTRYFIDIAKSGLDKKGHLILEYKDGERERLYLFGIHKAQLQTLISAIESAR